MEMTMVGVMNAVNVLTSVHLCMCGGLVVLPVEKVLFHV